MQISKKERPILIEKRDEIRKLGEEIVELYTNLSNNELEIRKRVNGIISLISEISCYAKPKKLDMTTLVVFVQQMFYNFDLGMPQVTKTCLDLFCTVTNSITFDFTKRELNINIQKIDLSLLKVVTNPN
jgi:hypothetical protein